jgi:N-acetylmuramoyl-L-alanine amidase
MPGGGSLFNRIALALTAATIGTLLAVVADAGSTAPSACQVAQFKVAIDIGHHPAQPGAISAVGVPEYDYNRALVTDLHAALRRAGFTSAFLINEAGAAIPLEERTRIADAAKADLLLSIHHDSVQPQYLATWSVAGQPQKYSDRYQGYSVFYSEKNKEALASAAFARLLGRALRDQGLTPSLHHAESIPGEGRPLIDPAIGLYRFDDLIVLKTATMPAVLLEAGIIVNRAEEQQLRSEPYRGRLVAALVKSIQDFCGILAQTHQ